MGRGLGAGASPLALGAALPPPMLLPLQWHRLLTQSTQRTTTQSKLSTQRSTLRSTLLTTLSTQRSTLLLPALEAAQPTVTRRSIGSSTGRRSWLLQRLQSMETTTQCWLLPLRPHCSALALMSRRHRRTHQSTPMGTHKSRHMQASPARQRPAILLTPVRLLTLRRLQLQCIMECSATPATSCP